MEFTRESGGDGIAFHLGMRSHEGFCVQTFRDGLCQPNRIALRTVSAIAAAWLIGLFLYQQIALSKPSSHSNEVPHYYTSHLSTGSTLKDVYTSRQTKHQFISYTQLRKMIYENK